MVNKNIDICDGCGKRTADKKCVWCGKDLCPYCRRSGFNIIFQSVDVHQLITEVIFCKDCKHKLLEKWDRKEPLFNEEIGKEICSVVQSYLTKRTVVESLNG